jgi:hypothetical protein
MVIKVVFIIIILLFFLFFPINSSENFTNNTIPKIIWGYWDTGIENAPDIVQKSIKNWKKNNPDWEINILNENNLQEYINTDIFDKIIVKDSIKQKKADLIRLLLLKKYGGIWVDASIFLSESLNWVLQLQKEKNVDIVCFYQEKYTTDYQNPVIENWFIASTKNNKFINLWLEDFFFYMKNGIDIYKKTIENINMQKLVNINYLTMHASALKLFYLYPGISKKIYAIPSGDGPFKYHRKYGKNNFISHIIYKDCDKDCDKEIPKLIKFRGNDRKVLKNLIEIKNYSPNSLYAKLLN